MCHAKWFVCAICTASAILLTAAPCLADFQGLGDLPGGATVSAGMGCSADGNVVVGFSFGLGSRAFRWTQAGGMADLGNIPGGYASQAEGCSGDGSAVVGSCDGPWSGRRWQAFRWTAGTGMIGLGDLPGGSYYSWAYAASSDGSVVVGHSYSGNGVEAFRWPDANGLMGALGDLSGGTFESKAYDCSADGSVVVGYGHSASGAEAFRWTVSGGMVGLGDLPGGGFGSRAYGCSSDGSVVVGGSWTGAPGWQAFRWKDGNMIPLGDLPGGMVNSEAQACSADGSVVVGIGNIGSSAQNAFIWDETNGLRSLADALIAQGDGNAIAGWTLQNAYDVSDDGRVIVGIGVNPSGQTEAFRAVIPEPATLGLLGVGLAGVVARHKRRKRK